MEGDIDIIPALAGMRQSPEPRTLNLLPNGSVQWLASRGPAATIPRERLRNCFRWTSEDTSVVPPEAPNF